MWIIFRHCVSMCLERESEHYYEDSFSARPIKTSKSETGRLVVQIATAAVTCLVYLTVVLRYRQGV
jgi:hypothetical protein